MSNADGTNGTEENGTGTQPLGTVIVSSEAGIPDEVVDGAEDEGGDAELDALMAELGGDDDEVEDTFLDDIDVVPPIEEVAVTAPQRVEHRHTGEVRHTGPVEHFHHWVGGCEGDFAAARPVQPTPEKVSEVIPMRPTSSSVAAVPPVRRTPAGNGGGGVNDTTTGADDDDGFKVPGWVWPLIGFLALLLLAFLAWNSRDRTPPPVPPAPVEEEEVVINIVEDNLVDVCEIAPAFERLDESLQEYWQDFGPQDTAPSCIPLEGTSAHIPCLEYRQWYRNERYCRHRRAAEHAARVISEAGLD